MKKLFLSLLCVLLSFPAFAVTQWTVNVPTNAADLKSNFPAENLAQQTILQTLLQNYRQGYVLSYLNSTTLTIGAGEISAWNGSAAIFLQNAASQTATTSQLDTGVSFNASTTYYVYAGATSGTAATATISISLNASTPSNLTWYKRLGSFLTDSSSNIAAVLNDGATQKIGAQSTKSIGSTYLATTDGFVVVNVQSDAYPSDGGITIYTDSSSSPTTVCAKCNSLYDGANTNYYSSATCPVKAGNYYKTTGSDWSGTTTKSTFFVPLN